ncbi:single-stranded DNA-binding protein [Marinilabiliaceae bacterium ANBcel2]|nr:single-stranded DNA-binding protein [Marinilabiliaceae bacterium ANBcel2]
MVNKVILLGNVGKDPDVKYINEDLAVANFSLATTERGFRTRDGQEIPPRTEWHNIVAWRGLAKIAENYIKKGSQIYVEGKLKTRSYDDVNGVTKYITEVFADTINLLGRPPVDKSTEEKFAYKSDSSTSIKESHTNDTDKSKGDDFLSGTDEQEDDLPF